MSTDILDAWGKHGMRMMAERNKLKLEVPRYICLYCHQTFNKPEDAQDHLSKEHSDYTHIDGKPISAFMALTLTAVY